MDDTVKNAKEFQHCYDVSRETMEKLEIYYSILQKWNKKINLVSKSTIETAWQRHFSDSAQIWRLAPEGAESWLDFGSGAGFPGLVIAAIAAEKSPQLSISLVESDRRKSIFLQQAAHEMGVSVRIHTCRIEDLPKQNANIISARALTSLSQLFDFTEKHLSKQGVCIFPKGARVDKELTEAANSWHISYDSFPSVTDSQSVILRIGEFYRV